MNRVCIGLCAVLACVQVLAQTPSVSATDKDEIQVLVAGYAEALGTCSPEAFANLFTPGSGYFASGFRGRVQGRDKLVALVESERHCRTADQETRAARPGGFDVPTVALDVTSVGVFGIADLGGAAQYQDEYVKTPQGWRFASRTVITPAEMAAGLDSRAILAIHRLSNDLETSDYYGVDDAGDMRFLASGVAIRVNDGTVTGRVYVDSGYYDDVYEKAEPGDWRIKSREFVPHPQRRTD